MFLMVFIHLCASFSEGILNIFYWGKHSFAFEKNKLFFKFFYTEANILIARYDVIPGNYLIIYRL